MFSPFQKCVSSLLIGAWCHLDVFPSDLRRGVQQQRDHLAELQRFRLEKEREFGVTDRGTGKNENPILGEASQREDLLNELYAKVNAVGLF